jgi:hypothetical protein
MAAGLILAIGLFASKRHIIHKTNSDHATKDQRVHEENADSSPQPSPRSRKRGFFWFFRKVLVWNEDFVA